METVLQIAAVCLVGAVLAAVLRQRSPEAALLLGLAVCAVVGALLLRGLADVLDMLEDLAAAGGLPPELLAPLVKTLGIALVSRLGTEICRDAGQGAMAAEWVIPEQPMVSTSASSMTPSFTFRVSLQAPC